MKKIKERCVKAVSLLLILLVFCLSTNTVQAASSKPKLLKSSASIVIGDKTTIKVKNVKKGSTITYSSNKKAVATVNKKGVVTGVKAGSANITVKVKTNGSVKKLTFKVKVKKPYLKSEMKKKTLLKGNTSKIVISDKPKTSTKAKYKWTTSNKKVATVKNGKVTAKSPGTATIKVKIYTKKFSYVLSSKITVKRKYYYVTFKSNGGSAVSKQSVYTGKYAVNPSPIPTKAGYTFTGWYSDSALTNKYSFNIPVTSDITLYAKWSAEIYDVSFNTNGGSSVSTQRVSYNEKAVQPSDVNKIGYLLDGWYIDSSLTTRYDFSSPVTKNITLFAKWNARPINDWDMGDQEVRFVDFYTDIQDVLVGQQTDITFYAELASQQYITDEVAVYDTQGLKIITLKDDGNGVDLMAGDGTFTGSTALFEDERCEKEYQAKCGTLNSNMSSITFFTEISDHEFENTSAIVEQTSTYDTAQEVADYLQESDMIEHVAISDDNKIVLYRTTEGITGIWEKDLSLGNGNNQYKGLQNASESMTMQTDQILPMMSADSGEEINSPSHSKKDVCVIRPFRHNGFTYDNFTDAGSRIADALGSSMTVFDDEEASVDVFKSLGSYGVILVDSHGTLSKVTNAAWTVFATDPYLLTGEEMTAWQAFTSADWQSERTVVVSTNGGIGGMIGGGIVAVGSKFFDKYYSNGSLNESMFFLGTCYSLHNNTLAQSLINKGAEVVFGYSEPVSVRYCNNTLQLTLLNQMLDNASDAQSAFNLAVATYGTEQNGNIMQMSGDGSYTLIDSKGSIAGNVLSYETGERISNAYLKIYNADGTLVKQIRTASDGSFEQKLPEGTYKIEVSAYGYITKAEYNITVVKNRRTYLEDALMLHPVATTRISGHVVDSTNGNPISGAVIVFRINHNNLNGDLLTYQDGGTVTLTTDSNGFYEFDQLPNGYYTMSVSHGNYVMNNQNISASENTNIQDVILAPLLEEDKMHIVLTWGLNPEDLDSHITGPAGDGSNFHVYYRSRTAYNNGNLVTDLDHDDTTSWGPETVTIHEFHDGKYRYYVHRYSGYGSISSSGAQIKVYMGNTLLEVFNVPVNQGSGDYWNVFEMDGATKQITYINTITD